MLHWNLAEWRHPRQCSSFAGISAVQSRSYHGVKGEKESWWTMYLHKWRLLFRRNNSEDVLSKLRDALPKLETILLAPRVFPFILVNVYVPPDACVSAVMQQLAEEISGTEQRYPNSLLIILGDLNKANISRELPKYRQNVTCPTRDSNILVTQ